MSDLLVKLYDIDFYFDEKKLQAEGIYVKKALIYDKNTILDFVSSNFKSAYAECEYALFNNLCYIAVKNKELIGYACYDATAKGFFGPTGVKESERGKGIGTALLLKSLYSMKESGYAYAIIGYAAESAKAFYKKQVKAICIEDSLPNKSIYKNMISVE